MSVPVVLPPEIVALRDACARLLERIEDERDPATVSSGSADVSEPFDLILSGILATHVTNLGETIEHLEDTFGELEKAMETGEYDSSTVYRILGRFEAYIEILRSNYIEVRAWRVSGEDLIARDLMASIYRHFLNEIRDWLADAVVALGDPIGALESLGVDIPDEAAAVEVVTEAGVAVVEIPLTLELTTPSEVADLNTWLERRALHLRREEKRSRRRAKRLRQEPIRRERKSAGFSNFVQGAIVGWWLSSWHDGE